MSRTFRRLPYPNLRLQPYPRKEDSFASLHRDRDRTYLRSIPHWWVNTFATRLLRRHDVQEIHRCIRLDCWDDHLPAVYRLNNFPYYW